MARNVTREETKRTRVQTTGQVVPLAVNTQVSAGGARPAFALADLIRAGGQLHQAIEQPRQTAQAAKDVETGNVDEDGGYYYRQKVDSLKARAWWSQDEQLLREKMKDLDLANMSGPELNGWIDNELGILYDGVDDPAMLNELVPRMAEFRKQVNEEVYVMQSEAEVAENAANIQQIAETNYATGSFDYQALHYDIAGDEKDTGAFKGKDINKVYFKILSDIAIRNGDPDLIRNIPDRWENGLATFKHIPDWNESILSAELRAVSTKVQNEAAATKADEDAEAELFNQTSREAMRLALTGDQGAAQQMIYDLSQRDGQDAKDLLNMHKGLSQLASVGDKLPADNNQVAALTTAVYTGSGSVSDLAAAFAEGVFGFDDGGVATYRQLLSALDARGKSDPEVNRQFGFNVGLLKSKYNPIDKLGKINNQVEQLQVTALKTYQRFVYGEGMDPDEAYTKTIGIFDERYEGLPNAGMNFGQAMTAGQAVGHLLSGDISPTQARANGLTVDLLDDGLKSGQLSTEEYDFLLDQLSE